MNDVSHYNRRTFLKASALAAASALASGPIFAQSPRPPEGVDLPVIPDVTWNKAP